MTKDKCSNADCAVCKMSWPSDTTFNPQTNDPDAMCRCLAEVQPRPEPTDFTFGNQCDLLTNDFCADVDCEICKYSWPTNSQYMDPWKFDPLTACRCEKEIDPNPEPLILSWGNNCDSLTRDECSNANCAVCRMSWPANTFI